MLQNNKTIMVLFGIQEGGYNSYSRLVYLPATPEAQGIYDGPSIPLPAEITGAGGQKLSRDLEEYSRFSHDSLVPCTGPDSSYIYCL